jgi:hypothetical protein
MFLSKEDVASYGLLLTQKDPEKKMMVWTNIKSNSKINRIVDIRWTLKTIDEAMNFHKKGLVHNSENMTEHMTEVSLGDLKPVGKEFHVYFKGSEDMFLMGLGLSMNMYNFLFVEKEVVAKVFVSGSGDLKLTEAVEIARKADERIKASFTSKK